MLKSTTAENPPWYRWGKISSTAWRWMGSSEQTSFCPTSLVFAIHLHSPSGFWIMNRRGVLSAFKPGGTGRRTYELRSLSINTLAVFRVSSVISPFGVMLVVGVPRKFKDTPSCSCNQCYGSHSHHKIAKPLTPLGPQLLACVIILDNLSWSQNLELKRVATAVCGFTTRVRY